MSSSLLLSAALEDAQRVVKKQKTTSSATSLAIEGALRILEEAHAKCDGGDGAAMMGTDDDDRARLAAAALALESADPAGVVASATKDLHGAVGKLGKVRERERVEKKKERREGERHSRTKGDRDDDDGKPFRTSSSSRPLENDALAPPSLSVLLNEMISRYRNTHVKKTINSVHREGLRRRPRERAPAGRRELAAAPGAGPRRRHGRVPGARRQVRRRQGARAGGETARCQ
jgi:hypothetical protein